MSTDVREFYDASYARADERQARWRELSARGKADHVVELAHSTGLASQRVVEIGCGDGALLEELARRGFGGSVAGFDISEEAIARARERYIPRLEQLDPFGGEALPVDDGAYDLGILSHVLEHVPDPAALLREATRACRALVVEVPLERNLSGARASKRAGSEAIGHLQELDRSAVRSLLTACGLEVVGELLDPLPTAVHTFHAEDGLARTRGLVKSGVRHALFRVSPGLAERAFTLHYACACVPAR